MALNTLLGEAVFFPPPELINPEGLLRLRQAGAEEAVLGAIEKIPPWGRVAALGWTQGTPVAQGRLGAWFASWDTPCMNLPTPCAVPEAQGKGSKCLWVARPCPLSAEGPLQEVTASCPFPPSGPTPMQVPPPLRKERETVLPLITSSAVIQLVCVSLSVPVTKF